MVLVEESALTARFQPFQSFQTISENSEGWNG
jgi:hypothetical protein